MVCEDVIVLAKAGEDDVLILVLVEYGLWEEWNGRDSDELCGLNPCFSGIWSVRQKGRHKDPP